MMSRPPLGVVVTDVDRPDRGTVDRLRDCGVATVHEAQQQTGLLSRDIRPVWTCPTVAGAAVTVLAPPGDNWMMHVAVEQCQPGDLLILATTSPNTDGYFGDLLATSLIARGVVGLVADAGVRDIADLEAMGFPVWSAAVSAKGTVKETLGSVNVPIVCGGVVIEPGDVVVADRDGAVAVPRKTVDAVCEAAEARIANEAEKRQRFEAGELGLDVYDMRDRLAAKGLRYVASLDELES